MKKRKHLKTKKEIAKEQSIKYTSEQMIYGKILTKQERIAEKEKQKKTLDDFLEPIKECDPTLYNAVKNDKNHFLWIALVGWIFTLENPKDAVAEFGKQFRDKGLRMFFQGLDE